MLEEYYKLRKSLAANNEEVTDLSMINPDIVPPRYAIDRLLEAGFSPKNHRYAVSRGVFKAREAVAFKYNQAFDVDIDPNVECCVTFGTKDAVLNSLKATLIPKDRVLIGAPSYSPYLSAISFLDFTPAFFEIDIDENKMLQSIINKLEEAKANNNRIKFLILNFPNNPTGITVSKNFIDRVIDLKEEFDFCLYNDFAYGEMVYEGANALSFISKDKNRRRNVVESYTLSKAYSLPGWRFAGVVGDERVIEKIASQKSKLDYGLFLPIQIAAAAVLKSSENFSGVITSEYAKRTNTFVKSFLEASANSKLLATLDILHPKAGCSVWFRLPKLDNDVSKLEDFCYRLLDEKRLAVTPGVTYGRDFVSYIRVAMVASDSILRSSATKIAELIHQYLSL